MKKSRADDGYDEAYWVWWFGY